MGKKKTPSPNAADIYNRSTTAYNATTQPSALENEMAPISQGFMNNYNNSVGRDTADQAGIMGGYRNFASSFRPTNQRPAELGESYGYLREAMPGYREFAETGGYSPQDVQELRARGIAPIRAAYGNTMMEMDRARSLGGASGAPNYIAAASKAQREMPGQMADAMTGVNAGLADSVRQGRQFGLSGMTNTGQAMGGLSSAEAGRDLQAQMANQGADLQAQGMGEQSLQSMRQSQLASLGGQASLYGTTPGQASMFGNQALNAYQQRAGMEQMRNQFGQSMLDSQLRGYGVQEATKGPSGWQTAANIAGTAAPYIAMAYGGGDNNDNGGGQQGYLSGNTRGQNPGASGAAPGGGSKWATAGKYAMTAASIAAMFSSRKLKHDIKPVENTSKFAKHMKDLPLYTWKYKGDNVRHFGPIAEEFKKHFGVGDGKTIHLADVMGVVLASEKERLKDA